MINAEAFIGFRFCLEESLAISTRPRWLSVPAIGNIPNGAR
jgi:hypothetical protein